MFVTFIENLPGPWLRESESDPFPLPTFDRSSLCLERRIAIVFSERGITMPGDAEELAAFTTKAIKRVKAHVVVVGIFMTRRRDGICDAKKGLLLA